MIEVPLIGKKGAGLSAIIDDDDYERVSKYEWHYSNGYAVNSFGYRMHRLIMLPPHDLVVDHINHNKLDNRRKNLRVCTQLENSKNKVCKAATYGNVYSNRNVTRWFACNRINGKNVYSKKYKTREEAEYALSLMRKGIMPN